MKAILVDDEQAARDGLRSILNSFTDDVEIIGEAHSVLSATKLIRELKPEVVFLDVEMQDGLGIDVLNEFKHEEFKTIFVTAYDQYAIDALRLQAFDYLLKPIDPDALEKAVDRARTAIEGNQLENIEFENELLSVPLSTGIRLIRKKDIIRLESDSNYTTIFLEDEKPILISKTIKRFEEALCKGWFIRVHLRHIVNFRKIKEVVKADGGTVILNNGDQIPIGKKNKDYLQKLLQLKVIHIS